MFQSLRCTLFECCAVRHRDEDSRPGEGGVPCDAAAPDISPGQAIARRPSCLRSKEKSRSGSAEFGSPVTPREVRKAGEEPIVVCVQQVRFASPRVTGQESSPRVEEEEARAEGPWVTGARPVSPRGQLRRSATPASLEAEAENKAVVPSEVPEYGPATVAQPDDLEREDPVLIFEHSQQALVEEKKDSDVSELMGRPSLVAADIFHVGGGKVRVSLLDARQQTGRDSLSPASSRSPVASPRGERSRAELDQLSPRGDRPRVGSGQVSPGGDRPRVVSDVSPKVSPRGDPPRAVSDIPSPRNSPRDAQVGRKLSFSLLDARGASFREQFAPPSPTLTAAKTGPGDKVAISLLGARAAGPKATSLVPGPSTNPALAEKVAVSLLSARSGTPKAAPVAAPAANALTSTAEPAPGEKMAFSLLGARGGPKSKPKPAVQQESRSPAEAAAKVEANGETKADPKDDIMEKDLMEKAKVVSQLPEAQPSALTAPQSQPEVDPPVQPKSEFVADPALEVPLVKPPAREEPYSGRSNGSSSTAPGTPKCWATDYQDVSPEAEGEVGEADDMGDVMRNWQWRNNALDAARQMSPAQQLSTLSTKEMEQLKADLRGMMRTYDAANPEISSGARRLNESRYMNILREKYVYKRD